MLLSDPKFVERVKDRYILAWQSVRPAPRVTIDFGNGKTLTRTLKGSTVFYLCKEDGKVVDIFPGVYTPQDFLALESEGRRLLGLSGPQILKQHARPSAGGDAGGELTIGKAVVESPLLKASSLTVSKAAMQGPILKSLNGPSFAETATPLDDLSKHPLSRSEVTDRVGLPPGASGSSIVAVDSRQYREKTRPAVHTFMRERLQLPTPDECLRPMFKDLLKVPLDDPYLGLGDSDMPGTDR